ncbi:MAG TPA: PAS domain S-box protein [Allocoleopsis sp.]
MLQVQKAWLGGKVTGVEDQFAIALSDSVQQEPEILRSSPPPLPAVELILEHMSDGFFVLDQQGCFTHANKRWLVLTGLTKADLLGKTLWQVFPDLSSSAIAQSLRDAFTTQTPVQFELFYPTLNHWFEHRIVPQPEGVAVFVTEITACKQVAAERDQLLEQLETQHAQFAAVLQQMPAGVLIADAASGELLLANDQGKQIVGYAYDRRYPIEAYDNETPFNGYFPNGERYQPEDWPLARSLRSGEVVKNEVIELVRSTGEHTFIEVNSAPIFAPEGGIVAAAVVFQDVTDRKGTEIALQDTKQRFIQLAETVEDVFWIANLQTYQVIYVSPAYERIWGRSCESLYASPWGWFESIYPEDSKQVEAVLFAHAQDSRFDVEYRVVRPDGSLRWVRDRGFPIHDRQGEIQQMAGIAQDITDRKEAEVRLRNRNLRLKLLYETTRDLLSSDQPLDLIDTLFQKLKNTLDLDLYFNYLVDADRQQMYLTSYCGITPAQAADIEWLDFGQALCGSSAAQRCQIVRSNLQESDDPRSALVRSLGIKAYAAQPLIAHGHLFGTLSFGSRSRTQFTPAETELMQALCDQMAIAMERAQLTTSLQQQTEQLRQANHIKDEFLAVLSHELRSPLNPILGWAKLLRTRQFDTATTQQALETIERNAHLQTQLIDDLLDVSRILRGKMLLTVVPVSLVKVIEAALETVQLSAEAKGIKIRTVFDPQVGQVLGDAGRLQQIVWNLLSNAIKFTAPGGWIEVALTQIHDRRKAVAESPDPSNPSNVALARSFAQITVTDTGKGIDPAFLPYVFEYFRQENGSTTRQFGGLGLGLAIVRHLTELHGGTVHADSPGIGQGATFLVQIPLLESRPEVDPEVGHPVDRSTLDQQRILVVDDESDMRDLVTTILQDYGAQVKSVASAADALSLLSHWQPDLLISDIGMPDCDGYRLLEQVRQLSPEGGGKIPAVALTAYAGAANQELALAAGFNLHLAKPIDPDMLVAALAQLLSREPDSDHSN